MAANTDVKKLIKILIGAAWIDGKIQPEEREHLRRVAQEKNVASDPEIQPLLYELVNVKPEECYRWVQDYLGDRPSPQDYEHLVEAVSALVYSDGDIAAEEAKLLSRLQLMDPADSEPESISQTVLKAIRKIYHRWIDQQS